MVTVQEVEGPTPVGGRQRVKKRTEGWWLGDGSGWLWGNWLRGGACLGRVGLLTTQQQTWAFGCSPSAISNNSDCVKIANIFVSIMCTKCGLVAMVWKMRSKDRCRGQGQELFGDHIGPRGGGGKDGRSLINKRIGGKIWIMRPFLGYFNILTFITSPAPKYALNTSNASLANSGKGAVKGPFGKRGGLVIGIGYFMDLCVQVC